jgi:hypothetical protein
MGVSRRAGDLIMGLISLLVHLVSMDPGGGMNRLRQHVHNQIPTSINAALSNLKLDGQVTVYAICPVCHFSHKPAVDRKSGRSLYPDRCSNRPGSDGKVCGEPLLIQNDCDPNVKKPIKPFVYHHFGDYLAGLLSQHEAVMDKAADDCMNSFQDPPPTLATGFFDAQFIRHFRGPKSDKLFIQRPESEGRYLFTLNLDYFNAEGRRVSGASTSCGLLSMACLNLPLEIRYLPENMYLSVIPGPSEPHLVEINHYLRPLIDDMVISWEKGFHISRTPAFPNGRNTRSAIAAVVSDTPAARQASALANHNSHFYCSVCLCYHLATRGSTNYNDWRPRDRNQMQQDAEAWRDANGSDRIKKFQANGIRWSELWRLPYWDPTRQLVVDPMHCLFLGLAQHHVRDLLQLSSEAALRSDPPIPAFHHNFPTPQETEELQTEDRKNILKIHQLLCAAITDNGDEGLSQLVKKLTACRFAALQFVCNSLELDVQPDPERLHPRYRTVEDATGQQRRQWILQKKDFSLALVAWVRCFSSQLTYNA